MQVAEFKGDDRPVLLALPLSYMKNRNRNKKKSEPVDIRVYVHEKAGQVGQAGQLPVIEGLFCRPTSAFRREEVGLV